MTLFPGLGGGGGDSPVKAPLPAMLSLSAASVLTLISFWGLLSLNRPSPELDPRFVMARLSNLARLVLSAERDCQDYLVSGSVIALEAYRVGNRGVEEVLAQLAASENRLGSDERLGVLREDLNQALLRWREDYAQKAVGYRISKRLEALDGFLRKNFRAQLSGRVQGSLDSLTQAYSRHFDAREKAKRRKEAFFILGIVVGPLGILLAGAFLLRGGAGLWRGLDGSMAGSGNLIRVAERIQASDTEESLSQAFAGALVSDRPGRESTVMLLNEDGVTVRIAGQKGGAEKGPAWAPLMDDKSACPVFASARCHRVDDVKASGAHTCPCPVGAPAEGGYLCVPLRDQGRVIGLANLRKAPGIRSDKQDSESVEMMALIASMGLASLRAARIMKQVSLTDNLTGVFNRKFMEASLRHQVQASLRLGHPLSLLLTDIDYFKQFNEVQSRAQGDLQLQAVAATIQESVRGGDLVSRFGGDEFLIMLPNTHFLDAKDIAEKIRGRAFQAGQSLSIGLSCLPEDAMAETELLLAADQALSVAKRQGRNRVICFQEMWPGISASAAGGPREPAAKA